MRYFDQHLPSRLLMGMLFSAIFTALGYFIPNFYYRYVDKTQYYTIEQPISTDKKIYKPCEVVKATIKRTALIDTTGSSVIDLLLIRQDNITEKVMNLNRTMAIPKGSRTLVVNWDLPCELVDGTYYWQAVVKFYVRGVEKNYSYFSDTFAVTQSGLDENTQDAIEEKK